MDVIISIKLIFPTLLHRVICRDFWCGEVVDFSSQICWIESFISSDVVPSDASLRTCVIPALTNFVLFSFPRFSGVRLDQICRACSCWDSVL